jgi:diguanylate cyclase (GGDEF)-like protein/PAS domain S-box-containing protein
MASAEALRILLVEDDEDDYVITRSMLHGQDRFRFDVEWADSYAAGLAGIHAATHDLYLVDYRLGERTGLDLIREAYGGDPRAPVILLTGQDDYRVDLEATELGVTDYLIKGSVDGPSLERTIRYAIRQHRALLDLRRSEERYAVAVRATNDGIWDWDLVEDRIHFSPRWKMLFGYGETAVSDRPDSWFGLVHPDDLERLRVELDDHLAGNSPFFENEHRIRHADGQWRWVLGRGLASQDHTGRAIRITGSLSDVTARHDAEQQMMYGALHDSLTGLPNRALFMDRLTHCLAQLERDPGFRCALLFIDLDRFKLVNDSLSHAAGDRLLVEVARRLKNVVRPEDTVARLGGDEFTVLLDRLSTEAEAIEITARVQAAIGTQFTLEGRDMKVAASIGIAHSSRDGVVGPAELVRNADIAMYDAKRNGGAGFQIFDTSMHQRVISRVSLETQLRQAIDNSSLRTFYQPIVDLGTHAITGFEALARWPAAGANVPPSEFIPIAEEAGLIGPLGGLMLDNACRTLADWRRRGLVADDVTMSVNVSTRQLTDSALVEQVRGALARASLPAGSLVLEITESTLIERPELMRAMLRDLLALGVGIQLDDFGTGYSSLTVLHHFPGDTLKIDRSFVTGLAERAESQVIVRSIIGLAHNLGLRVIAEGIDNHDQIDLLTSLGCECGQGFYFARPLEASELEPMLAPLQARAPAGST